VQINTVRVHSHDLRVPRIQPLFPIHLSSAIMFPPSDSPEPWEMDPSTAEAWRERERRQRSVRLLMMFLLMLLLMDGEEQSNRRRNEPLLRRKKNSRKPVILEQSVFRARRDQDEAILKLTKTHPRFLELLALNGKINYEAQARKWADQFTAEDQEDIEADDDGDEDERKVFHYPWNATGFYRGEWIREEMEDEEIDGKNKEEDHEEFKEKPVQFMTPLELERTMSDMLARQEEQIGVFLLPEGIHVQMENSTAMSSDLTAAETDRQGNVEQPSNFKVAVGTSVGRAASPFMRYSDFTTLVEEEDDQSSIRLPLTKLTGRAALQLYSRSVPSMKELSLVEGFVKLYDSNTVGYSTRRDILLRARGVLIHSIGRLSLVSNAAPGRALFVVSDQSTHEKTNKKSKSDQTKNVQSTRLLKSLEEVHKYSDPSMLDQIRQDAMDLYPYDAQEENFKGWNIMSSFSHFDDDIQNLNNSNDKSFSDERGTWFNEILKNFLRFGETWSDMIPNQRNLRQDVTALGAAMKFPLSDNDDDVFTDEGPFLNLTQINETIAFENRRAQVADVDDSEEGHEVLELVKMSNIVFPFPYVRDDKGESVRKAKTPASRRMPLREQTLEANAGSCEFQINLDVKEIEWTMGEWKRLMIRRVQDTKNSDPSIHKNDPDEADEIDEGDASRNTSHWKRKHESNETPIKERALLKPMQDQALIMMMTGAISSLNCDFTASLNVTAIRTDWEQTTSKAINYSFYMMLTCLTQIVVLLRQLLHTQAQSTAIRVSLLCIGWQTVLDALVCLAHVYLSLAIQPLFTAFASVAFFKLLIFCVIEMKYMAIILQARSSATGGQNLAESLRRQVALIHVRFYVALVFAFLAFFYAGQKYRTIYILALYSFWVPQIVQNVVTEAKRPLHIYYIYGMSITRMVAPLYIFAVPDNFLKEVYPDSPTNIFMCEILVVWVGIQAFVLIAQGKYGARFMVPARFLPPKFDYNRPVPPSMMPTDDILEPPVSRPDAGEQTSEPALLSSETSPERTTTGTRNRTKKGKARVKTETTSMITESLTENPTGPTLDCVICCNDINLHNRRGYMLAPCDHIFHRECLVQWMDVKMECPVCRKELPAI